jgi:hypothetical protein
LLLSFGGVNCRFRIEPIVDDKCLCRILDSMPHMIGDISDCFNSCCLFL